MWCLGRAKESGNHSRYNIHVHVQCIYFTAINPCYFSLFDLKLVLYVFLITCNVQTPLQKSKQVNHKLKTKSKLKYPPNKKNINYLVNRFINIKIIARVKISIGYLICYIKCIGRKSAKIHNLLMRTYCLVNQAAEVNNNPVYFSCSNLILYVSVQ